MISRKNKVYFSCSCPDHKSLIFQNMSTPSFDQILFYLLFGLRSNVTLRNVCCRSTCINTMSLSLPPYAPAWYIIIYSLVTWPSRVSPLSVLNPLTKKYFLNSGTGISSISVRCAQPSTGWSFGSAGAESSSSVDGRKSIRKRFP